MPPPAPKPDETIHATCVIVGERGVLISGPSGAGKSTLARVLIAAARQAGWFACLVSDDRTRIGPRHGRLVARAVPALAGQIEVRGVGLLPVPHETAAVVALMVELVPGEPPRLPGPQDGAIELCGISVPRLWSAAQTPLEDVILALMRLPRQKFTTMS